MEPALDHLIAEKIGEREDAHTLMVSHPGADDLAGSAHFVSWTKVDGFVKAIGTEPTEAIHAMQIAQGFGRVDGESEERGVGRDHEQIQLALHHGKLRNTKRVVLVVPGFIKLVVGRLGNSPRHTLTISIGLLEVDDSDAAAIEQSVGIG